MPRATPRERRSRSAPPLPSSARSGTALSRAGRSPRPRSPRRSPARRRERRNRHTLSRHGLRRRRCGRRRGEGGGGSRALGSRVQPLPSRVRAVAREPITGARARRLVTLRTRAGVGARHGRRDGRARRPDAPRPLAGGDPLRLDALAAAGSHPRPERGREGAGGRRGRDELSTGQASSPWVAISWRAVRWTSLSRRTARSAWSQAVWQRAAQPRAAHTSSIRQPVGRAHRPGRR